MTVTGSRGNSTCNKPADAEPDAAPDRGWTTVSRDITLLQRPRQVSLVVRPLEPDGALLTVTWGRAFDSLSDNPAGASPDRERRCRKAHVLGLAF
jgi:hypothetical protein